MLCYRTQKGNAKIKQFLMLNSDNTIHQLYGSIRNPGRNMSNIFLSRGHDILSHGVDLLTRGLEIISRVNDLITRGHELISHGHE